MVAVTVFEFYFPLRVHSSRKCFSLDHTHTNTAYRMRRKRKQRQIKVAMTQLSIIGDLLAFNFGFRFGRHSYAIVWLYLFIEVQGHKQAYAHTYTSKHTYAANHMFSGNCFDSCMCLILSNCAHSCAFSTARSAICCFNACCFWGFWFGLIRLVVIFLLLLLLLLWFYVV